MQLHAAVFDMDGTLVDSERVIMREWIAAAEAVGRPLARDDYARVIGLNDEESNDLLARLLGGWDAFELVRTSVRQRLSASRNGVTYPLKPGVRELLSLLRARGVPCAVASSSSRAEIEERLSMNGVLGFFQAIAGGDEVRRGKPDPAVYRLAATRLGVRPDCCLAFEDSAHGAASAMDAGMRVVLVPDMRAAEPALAQSVLAVLESLAMAVPRVPAWFPPRADA